ncbi:peptide chain release factor N(5)-glutamine methyltransferase [Verrucomicrobia bacterium LW23]|nr:peptide chain release factor N(5)-glutamine methyltransferase [Verrucomicrobia bacterium LW23]
MRLLDVMENTTRYFAKHSVESPRLTIDLLLAEVLKKTRLQLYLDFEMDIPDATLDKLRPMVKARAGGEPLEYILGYKQFDGHRFTVTPDVLVPRYETELLLQAAVPLVDKSAPAGAAGPRPVLDVGTGSGIMGVSLARRFPEVPVVAFDISEKALAVARGNGAGVGNISFYHSNLLGAWLDGNVAPEHGFGRAPQVIVANLPYIPTEQISTLSREVQREPKLALDGGPDGLDLIRTLAQQAAQVGAEHLVLEHGDGQSADIASILTQNGFSISQIMKDLSYKERVIAGSRRG